MVTLEAILSEYESQNIPLFDCDNDMAATTIFTRGRFGVFINSRLVYSLRDGKCLLVHELGHCDTGTTHKVHSPHQLVAQHEHRAKKSSWLKWAPPETFHTAFSLGYTTPWEIAEWIDLPEKFIVDAWTYYANNGLL